MNGEEETFMLRNRESKAGDRARSCSDDYSDGSLEEERTERSSKSQSISHTQSAQSIQSVQHEHSADKFYAPGNYDELESFTGQDDIVSDFGINRTSQKIRSKLLKIKRRSSKKPAPTRPLRYLAGWIYQKIARTRITRNDLLNLLIGVIGLTIIGIGSLVLAVFTYVLIYWTYIPQRHYAFPVHFHYPPPLSSPLPQASLTFDQPSPSIAGPWAILEMDAAKFTRKNIAYDVSLEFGVPDIEGLPESVGNFMIGFELFALGNGKLDEIKASIDQQLAKPIWQDERPVLLKYRSWMIRLINTFIHIPVYLSGIGEEVLYQNVCLTENMTIRDIEINVKPEKTNKDQSPISSKPQKPDRNDEKGIETIYNINPWNHDAKHRKKLLLARLKVNTTRVPFLHNNVQLHFVAHFRGLCYFMYHWFIMSMIVGIIVLFGVYFVTGTIVFAILAWLMLVRRQRANRKKKTLTRVGKRDFPPINKRKDLGREKKVMVNVKNDADTDEMIEASQSEKSNTSDSMVSSSDEAGIGSSRGQAYTMMCHIYDDDFRVPQSNPTDQDQITEITGLFDGSKIKKS